MSRDCPNCGSAVAVGRVVMQGVACPECMELLPREWFTRRAEGRNAGGRR